MQRSYGEVDTAYPRLNFRDAAGANTRARYVRGPGTVRSARVPGVPRRGGWYTFVYGNAGPPRGSAVYDPVRHIA